MTFIHVYCVQGQQSYSLSNFRMVIVVTLLNIGKHALPQVFALNWTSDGKSSRYKVNKLFISCILFNSIFLILEMSVRLFFRSVFFFSNRVLTSDLSHTSSSMRSFSRRALWLSKSPVLSTETI